MLLVDSRYAQTSSTKNFSCPTDKLPQWIKARLSCAQNYGEVHRSLHQFFKFNKQKCWNTLEIKNQAFPLLIQCKQKYRFVYCSLCFFNYSFVFVYPYAAYLWAACTCDQSYVRNCGDSNASSQGIMVRSIFLLFATVKQYHKYNYSVCFFLNANYSVCLLSVLIIVSILCHDSKSYRPH